MVDAAASDSLAPALTTTGPNRTRSQVTGLKGATGGRAGSTRSRPSPTRSCSDGAPAGRDHDERPFRLLVSVWLAPAAGGMAACPLPSGSSGPRRSAPQYDRRRRPCWEGKAFGDLGRDIAVRARYGGQHCSASGYMPRRP